MKYLLKNFTCAIALIYIIESNAQSNAEPDSVERPNRHDFVTRGNHPNEIKLGTYVIVGTTLTETDAKLMVAQFRKLGYPEPSYGFLTNKSYWYLYYGDFNTIEQAQIKRDEYRKFKMYKNARLLTVHE